MWLRRGFGVAVREVVGGLGPFEETVRAPARPR